MTADWQWSQEGLGDKTCSLPDKLKWEKCVSQSQWKMVFGVLELGWERQWDMKDDKAQGTLHDPSNIEAI